MLDCDGLVLAPGLVDLHAHLRQPGREDKETVESGCRAAAVGGFTAVSPMANTDPVADNAAVIHEVLELARAAGTCDVFPVGAITRGLGGEEMAELGEMVDAGVRMFSDDGRCVPNARVLRNALTYVRAFEGVVIAEHCEDASLAEGGQMHEGLTSSSLGLGGPAREAEEVVVARDLAIARLTGRPVAPVPSLVGRLGRDGAPGQGRGSSRHGRGHAAPPRVQRGGSPHLRHEHEDEPAAALRRGSPRARGPRSRDGTIDAVATDHAPHAVEEKEAEFDQAPFGTIGLETALAAVLTHLVEPGELTLARAIDALSTAPARILGAGDHGGPIEPGRPANLVVFDPSAEWAVEPPFASKSRNSAFLGRRLRGRVVHTMLRGELVVADGKAQR